MTKLEVPSEERKTGVKEDPWMEVTGRLEYCEMWGWERGVRT